MANVTRNGVIYDTDDLIRLANINAFGDMSQAVWGALIHIKELEKQNIQLKAELAGLKSLMSEGKCDKEEPKEVVE